MQEIRVETVADGVHVVRTPMVNWVLLTDGDAVVLVDAGYPRDTDAVVASLAALGRRPEDLAAVLVTHGHVDHIGGLDGLQALPADAPVLTGHDEVAHLRGDVVEQVTPTQVAVRLWRPRTAGWALRAAALGATAHVTVPRARGVDDGVALDLPGRPVPVAVPGHTSGHTAWHLPDRGVVLSGDALVTGHPLTAREGPQLLDPMFHHDAALARAAWTRLAGLAADAVVPGHGPVHHGPVPRTLDP